VEIRVKPEDKGRTALVTGASSGIGADIARVSAEHGMNVILTARRIERLEALAAEIAANHRVDVAVIPADLSKPDAPQELFDEITKRGLKVDILYNNAGVGDAFSFHEADWSAHQNTLQLMLVNPTHLSYLVIPGMLERGYGRIANITSIAAHMPGMPMHGMYCPLKTFLYKQSQTFASEYHDTPLTFTAIAPGLAETEIIDTSGVRDMVDTLPKALVATPRDVAEQSVAATLAGRAVFTIGWANQVYGGLIRHMPSRIGHKLMAAERVRVKAMLSGEDQQAAPLPGIPLKFGRRNAKASTK
jgi:short-subunit dehydrogenase